MINKLIKIATIIIMIVFMGCEDVLDRTPLDKISDANVFKDEALMEGYIIDLYRRFPFFEFSQSYWYSDESTSAWGNNNAITSGVWDSNNIEGAVEYWDYGYIRDVNYFLERLVDAPVDDDVKAQYEGEVRAIRATAYFELARRYGGVPLITEVLDPTTDIDEALLRRNKEEAIFDFVDSEYDIAINLLENTDDITPRERLNKWSALALKSRADLWAASIAKNGTVALDGMVGIPSNRADEFYQKASDAASEILASGNYELYNIKSDKSENYQYIFLDEDNSEIIFSKGFDGVNISHAWDWLIPPSSIAGQGSRLNPTLEFVLSYENIDGSEEDYYSYFNEDNLYNSGRELFENKDPRLFGTVLFQGDDFAYIKVQTYEGIDTGAVANPANILNNPSLSYQNYTQVGVDSRLVIGDDRTTNSGFLTRKFCDEENMPVPQGRSQVDWPLIRLAEVYLTKAEAEFELGNINDAVTALNKTRERAGISLVDGGTITEEKIHNEWLVEFALENHRFWDLRRWRKAEEVLNNRQFHGLRIIWHFKSGKYYFLPMECETFSRVFRPEHYYNPFSTNRINNNPLIVQNPIY